MVGGVGEYFRRVLSLYVSALNVDFDDNVADNVAESITVASSVVALALTGLWASRYFIQWQLPDVLPIAAAAILLILVWVAMTSVVSTKKRIPLHLNLASFWVLVTCLIIVIVRATLPGEYGTTGRFFMSLGLLVVLVPIHVLRWKMERRRKLLYVGLILAGHGLVLCWVAAGL